MIIDKGLDLNFCENPWEGSFIVDDLTGLVEQPFYQELKSVSESGGALGAMDTTYQRGKTREEILYDESRKHDGSLPIVAFNTFLPPTGTGSGHAEGNERSNGNTPNGRLNQLNNWAS